MLSKMALLATLAIAACAAPARHPVTSSRPQPSQSFARVGLGELRLDLGRDRVLLVHEDGAVELGGFAGLRVFEDGRVATAAGVPVLALEPDGSIRGRDGTRIERLHLDTDGMLTNAGKKIEIDRFGRIVGIRAPGARIEGATDALLRRTALLVIVAATIDSSGSAPDDLVTNHVALPTLLCGFPTST